MSPQFGGKLVDQSSAMMTQGCFLSLRCGQVGTSAKVFSKEENVHFSSPHVHVMFVSPYILKQAIWEIENCPQRMCNFIFCMCKLHRRMLRKTMHTTIEDHCTEEDHLSVTLLGEFFQTSLPSQYFFEVNFDFDKYWRAVLSKFFSAGIFRRQPAGWRCSNIQVRR